MILITIDNNKDAFRIRMNKSRTRVLGKSWLDGRSRGRSFFGRLLNLFGVR